MNSSQRRIKKAKKNVFKSKITFLEELLENIQNGKTKEDMIFQINDSITRAKIKLKQ